ncbi:hypothetical protein [Mesorhizobium caraganae]|uniref:hypothetical protein n=1 Tax=Mesorhizobium caraganae TaxID=483206 RepID=UPI003ECD63CF
MSAFEDSLHRVLARTGRRALAVRTSSSLSHDPDVTIGIATIKIVTEEQIQAIAYGPIGAEPTAIVRLNPIGRDVTDLLPFARFLEDAVQRAVATNSPVRVWLPHAVTLEALDVLGHRYWRNQNAPAEIVRMGEICRIIAHEAMIPGQQVVADATAQLQSHVVTGMAPIEEGHLDAILAWMDPAVRDPLVEARDRIRLPASGILPNTPDHPFDDRVDKLRKEAKSASGARRARIESEIDAILQHWVLREWRLMVEGRQAFLGLGLPATGLEDLVSVSTKRVADALANGFFPARQPDRLAAQLGEMEAGQEKSELIALEHDPLLREQAIRAGGVVVGSVVAVHQVRPGQKPCTIDVQSDQAVIRFRLDDKVRVVGTNIEGVVRALGATTTGGTLVTLEIQVGVRTRVVLTVGAGVELIRAGFGFVNYKALSEVRAHRPWLFYGDVAPVVAPRLSTGQSALALAKAARRP